MTEEEVTLLARLAGLEIDPAYLPGVARNLDILFDQAGLLGEHPVPAVVEPAPVFRA